MTRPDPLRRDQVNWTQYDPSRSAGHYESFYLRGNDPQRPLAFWIRYTIFSPAGRPADALGELWAIVFDGETNTHATAKLELPLAECAFPNDRFEVRVGQATLDGGEVRGQVGQINWELRYEGDDPPLYLLPERLYGGGFPKAKSLVSRPLVRFTGGISVDTRGIAVDGWLGSQNHNWGSRHTDHYAFGQVAGFDNAPDSFLEVATARNRIGPLWTPALTPWCSGTGPGARADLDRPDVSRHRQHHAHPMDLRHAVDGHQHPRHDRGAARGLCSARVPQPARRHQVLSQHQTGAVRVDPYGPVTRTVEVLESSTAPSSKSSTTIPRAARPKTRRPQGTRIQGARAFKEQSAGCTGRIKRPLEHGRTIRHNRWNPE
jgi:hypothetical protein